MGVKNRRDSADNSSMECAQDQVLVHHCKIGALPSACAVEYQVYMDWLRDNPPTLQNCTKVPYGRGMCQSVSSPFVSALVGLVISALPETSRTREAQAEIVRYLCGQFDERGLIGFLDPNFHRFELDTLATTYAFLSIADPDASERRNRRIEPFFQRNQCSTTGAYFTWIDKPENQVDFAVNLNIRLFRAVQGVTDCQLDDYLAKNVEAFLSNGSHYYANTLFPRLLATVYSEICPAIKSDRPFGTLLSKMRLSNQQLQDLVPTQPGMSKRPIWQSFHIEKCFNSRDATYRSEAMDKALGAFVSYKCS